MSKEHVDDYAETQVLPPKKAPPRDEPADVDPLALYEEYARTVGESAQRAIAGARRAR